MAAVVEGGSGVDGAGELLLQPPSSCLVRRDMRENVLPHDLHEYRFTSEWVWRWARRLDRSANEREQCGQENGFSPVCVRM